MERKLARLFLNRKNWKQMFNVIDGAKQPHRSRNSRAISATPVFVYVFCYVHEPLQLKSVAQTCQHELHGLPKVSIKVPKLQSNILSQHTCTTRKTNQLCFQARRSP